MADDLPQLDLSTLQSLRVDRLSGDLEGVVEVVLVSKAMNVAFWREMRSVFTFLRHDLTTRAIIVRGADGNKHFTQGLDLFSMGSTLVLPGTDAARNAIAVQRIIEDMQNSFTVITRCPQPVIAAVHGYCVGGGIDLITACDVRMCSADAKFTIKEVDIALAADVGTLQRLPRVVGNASWIREKAFTGDVFDAQEAERVGLVSRLVGSRSDLTTQARSLAREIVSKSPVAITGIKAVLNHAENHSVDDGLHFVRVWNSFALQTPDLAQAAQNTLIKARKASAARSRL